MATGHITGNMGGTDRRLRAFVIAPVAIGAALGLGAASVAGIVLLGLAGIMLATSALGFCPLYTPLGIDTRGRATLPHRPVAVGSSREV